MKVFCKNCNSYENVKFTPDVKIRCEKCNILYKKVLQKCKT